MSPLSDTTDGSNSLNLENCGAPAWFLSFQQKLDGTLDKFFTSMKEATIESQIQVQQEMKSIRKNLNILAEHLTIVDTCELHISGIPHQIFSYNQIVSKIFGAMDLNDIISQVICIRPWQRYKNHTNSAAQCELSSSPTSTHSIVIKVTSPTVRDFILTKTSVLKNRSARMIFGLGGDNKVFVNALWPKEIYLLEREAQRTAKEKGYAKPIVRNLVVCMRENNRSAFIPVHSTEDLNHLPYLQTKKPISRSNHLSLPNLKNSQINSEFNKSHKRLSSSFDSHPLNDKLNTTTSSSLKYHSSVSLISTMETSNLSANCLKKCSNSQYPSNKFYKRRTSRFKNKYHKHLVLHNESNWRRRILPKVADQD